MTVMCAMCYKLVCWLYIDHDMFKSVSHHAIQPRKCANGIVECTNIATDKTVNIELGKFQDKEYREFDAANDPKVCKNFFTKGKPSASFDMQVALFKAGIIQDFNKVLQDNEWSWEWLSVQTKPKKQINVTDAYDKGALVLVGASPEIKHCDASKKVSDSAIKLGCKRINGKDVMFFVNPTCTFPDDPDDTEVVEKAESGANEQSESSNQAKKIETVQHTDDKRKPKQEKSIFSCPFWIVPTTELDNTVNMELAFETPKNAVFPVPIMRNKKQLKVGEALHQKPAKKRKLN
jgi:hypothetical protein